jgi:hypothetical protein
MRCLSIACSVLISGLLVVAMFDEKGSMSIVEPGNFNPNRKPLSDLFAHRRQLLQFSPTQPFCATFDPPEGIRTPIPLLSPSGAGVTVSFLIGTNGSTHSLLIVDSGGPSEDRIVTQTLLSWRYRPGTCDGDPIEVEGKMSYGK